MLLWDAKRSDHHFAQTHLPPVFFWLAFLLSNSTTKINKMPDASE